MAKISLRDAGQRVLADFGYSRDGKRRNRQVQVGLDHQQPKRVRAHIFVAALAFLLDRALEKKLKAAGVPMSSAQALEALRTMHIVDIRVGAEIRRGVTAGNHQARQILAALGISDREPLQAQFSTKNGRLVTN